MQFQILTPETPQKMSRWELIKWLFRGMAGIFAALVIRTAVVLWFPDARLNPNPAPPPIEARQTQSPAEPISHQLTKKRKRF
ncbi:MAG: hypothetical protein RL329_682 [Bacteroidota bacterium]|jgi:heme/copper-type cytochrome/quinol oxidase subunit 2